MVDIDAVVAGYVGTLLWSEHCNGTAPQEVCDHMGRGGDCDKSLEYLNYGPDDLSASAREEIAEDVRDFCEANLADLADLNAWDIGHNFVLSRNGNGDRGWSWGRGWGERGQRLHGAAKVYGTMGAYVGDDGRVHTHG